MFQKKKIKYVKKCSNFNHQINFTKKYNKIASKNRKSASIILYGSILTQPISLSLKIIESRGWGINCEN